MKVSELISRLQALPAACLDMPIYADVSTYEGEIDELVHVELRMHDPEPLGAPHCAYVYVSVLGHG